MSIQIKQVTVIDDSRNFINLASVKTGVAGTQSWNSGQSSVNIGDGIIYGPGSPDGTVPLPSAGDIKIDGNLVINSITQIVFPLA
jgi:hypothetical protein